MVVTHPQTGHQLNIGLDMVSVPRLRDSLELAEMSGCDFLLAPLAHPRYERANVAASYQNPDDVAAAADGDSPPLICRDEPLTRSDLELSSGEWMAGVFAKLSPWIRPDCPHPALRAASEAAFAEEVAFAAHVSLKALIIPAPNGGAQGVANLARCISAALAANPSLRLWLRLPVIEPPGKVPPISFNDEADVVLPSEQDMEPWEIWNVIRTMCGEHPNLGVALELTADLPSRAVLDRWVAEPIRVVLLSTSAYVTNRVGYPVLSRRHQDFIKVMFKMRPFFALTGRAHKVKGGDGYRPFVQYLAHLFGKMPGASEAETFEAPYYDYLQAPLQPLSDNLESQTYETFERDPVKYTSYEEAVRQCLVERSQASEGPIVVMVLGAGRGPLVKCVLRASKAAMKQVTVFAVEKNPNAVVTLRNMKKELEWENVTIIASDMRRLEGVVQADIIVSELLGSFGDNELSPECLDGANKLLKEGGVSIPSTYTSFLAPLASTKLHNEVKAYGTTIAQMETPYVVRIHRGRELAPSKACFMFAHPNRDDVIDNSRYSKMQFDVSETNVLHGFAGYFETTLYGDVKLSIRPETFSDGMFSWFPLYFPISAPIYAVAGKSITVHMWRRCSETKVWYEWAVSDPTVTAIHNPNGRSYSCSLN
jgi:type II protein arginine methyltransferase